MKNKLLVIDDELGILSLIRDYFAMNDYEVLCAKNGNEGIKLVEEKPDIILLDINMPDIDGLEVCKKIRSKVDCPIIFLTARDTNNDLIYGLSVGGDDYITKPFNIRELEARVESHLRRDRRLRDKGDMLNRGLVINYAEMTASFNGQPIQFTKSEFRIVELLSRHKGQIFDKERIYETIRGYDCVKDSTVVTEHIRKIRQKFSDAQCPSCIETVWGVGYKWIK